MIHIYIVGGIVEQNNMGLQPYTVLRSFSMNYMKQSHLQTIWKYEIMMMIGEKTFFRKGRTDWYYWSPIKLVSLLAKCVQNMQIKLKVYFYFYLSITCDIVVSFPHCFGAIIFNLDLPDWRWFFQYIFTYASQ